MTALLIRTRATVLTVAPWAHTSGSSDLMFYYGPSLPLLCFSLTCTLTRHQPQGLCKFWSPAWNPLPPDVCLASSLTSFRSLFRSSVREVSPNKSSSPPPQPSLPPRCHSITLFCFITYIYKQWGRVEKGPWESQFLVSQNRHSPPVYPQQLLPAAPRLALRDRVVPWSLSTG